MAKAQNTFAKRQREMEKKRKANDKRERRVQKKLTPGSSAPPPSQLQAYLSQGEQSVLNVFRQYMINQGQMFCFGEADYQKLRIYINILMQKGALSQEKISRSYSLTAAGFAMMKNNK